MNGVIMRSTQYSVWCARCRDGLEDYEEYSEGYRGAEKAYREMGWRKRKDGWICPGCAKMKSVKKAKEKS